MSLPARLALRLVFAALLLSLPAMVIVRERIGEPYPALYQPAFDGIHMRGDTIRRDVVDIVVRDRSGTDHSVAADRLVDAPEVDDSTVDSMVRSLLRKPGTVRSPEVAALLRRRLVDLGISSPVRMRVTWYVTTRDARRPDEVVRGRTIDRYTVRLDG